MHTRYIIKYIHFRQITCCLVRRLVDSSSRFARVRINFILISKSHTKKPKTLFRLIRTLQRQSKQNFFWAKTFLKILQKKPKTLFRLIWTLQRKSNGFLFGTQKDQKRDITFQIGTDPLAKIKHSTKNKKKLFRLVRTLYRKSKQNFFWANTFFDILQKKNLCWSRPFSESQTVFYRKSKQNFFWTNTFFDKKNLDWSGPFSESQTVFYL